ncbi:MAG TPA: dihydrodipicolinate synthase family protein [Lacunisphaera sp.]|nr:dihydrodipicolinate synthase family protein [Lacunisphaera sp.]
MPTSPALDGIIAVPATPFTSDNQVDVESIRRYARKALAAGVVGFLAPADAGEVGTLSQAERDLVVTTFLDEIKGRVPLIGGATDADPQACLAHARRYIGLGCAGVLAYIKFQDEASYVAQVRALDALNPGFLMVQDLDRGQAPLPVSLVARLHRECARLAWVKVETNDRCPKISAIREATGGSLRIGTAGPDLIELMDRGVQAYMPTLYHEVYVRIWNLHRAGRREEAVALYYRLLPCLAFNAGHKHMANHTKKAVLQAEGIFTTRVVRAADRAPDPVEARLLAEICQYGLGLSA